MGRTTRASEGIRYALGDACEDISEEEVGEVHLAEREEDPENSACECCPGAPVQDIQGTQKDCEGGLRKMGGEIALVQCNSKSCTTAGEPSAGLAVHPPIALPLDRLTTNMTTTHHGAAQGRPLYTVDAC